MAITVLKTIRIDVKQDTYIYPYKVKQNDTLTLNFSIWDDYVSADLSNYTCLLKVNKSKGKGYEIRDATINGNNVNINCPSSITQFAGELLLELCFIDSENSLQKSSFNIIVDVQKSVLVTNDSGDLPQCIITASEQLDKEIKEAEINIQEARTINGILSNTVNNADTINTKLNSAINRADVLNDNLNNSITIGKQTVEELKKTNGEYTGHIKDSSIHITKSEREKWNGYNTRIKELTNIIDNALYKNATVIDDNGNTVVDDEGNTIIV